MNQSPILSSLQLQTTYLIINAVNRQKIHVHLLTVLHLPGDLVPQIPYLPLNSAGRLPSPRYPMPTQLPDPGYVLVRRCPVGLGIRKMIWSLSYRMALFVWSYIGLVIFVELRIVTDSVRITNTAGRAGPPMEPPPNRC